MTAELEAAIRANRDDPAPYLVYADWLQSRGELLGELIVLSHQGKPTADTLARLRLPPTDLASLEWKWGLWQSVTLANERDWMDASFDALRLAREVFAHPACCALERLHTGVLRWDFNQDDVPAVLREAASYAWARDLRTLYLGDVTDVDMSHHVVGDVGAAISASFPGLVELTIHSGSQNWRDSDETFGVAKLALPRLRELTIETCAMTTERLSALLDAALPRLARLELWFGSRDYDAAWEIGDLAPLLAGVRHTSVRNLGLANCDLADDLAVALPGSAIAARLESLDLSMGTLSWDGARALADGAARFTSLQKLDVSENHLTQVAIDALRAAFQCEVEADDQKDDDLSIAGEVHRYVSVHE